MGEERSLLWSGPLERGLTQAGSRPYLKHYTRLEKLVRSKHSSFSRKIVNYGSKKFYHIGTRSDPNLCLITRTNVEEIFALDLSRMEACGVRECQEQV